MEPEEGINCDNMENDKINQMLSSSDMDTVKLAVDLMKEMGYSTMEIIKCCNKFNIIYWCS